MQVTEDQSRSDSQGRDACGSEQADRSLAWGWAARLGLHLSLPPPPPGGWGPRGGHLPPENGSTSPKASPRHPRNLRLLNAPGRRTGHPRRMLMENTRKMDAADGAMGLGRLLEGGASGCTAACAPKDQTELSGPGQGQGQLRASQEPSPLLHSGGAGDGQQTPGAGRAPGRVLTSNSQPSRTQAEEASFS